MINVCNLLLYSQNSVWRLVVSISNRLFSLWDSLGTTKLKTKRKNSTFYRRIRRAKDIEHWMCRTPFMFAFVDMASYEFEYSSKWQEEKRIIHFIVGMWTERLRSTRASVCTAERKKHTHIDALCMDKDNARLYIRVSLPFTSLFNMN